MSEDEMSGHGCHCLDDSAPIPTRRHDEGAREWVNVDACWAATRGEGDARLHGGKSNPFYQDVVAVPSPWQSILDAIRRRRQGEGRRAAAPFPARKSQPLRRFASWIFCALLPHRCVQSPRIEMFLQA